MDSVVAVLGEGEEEMMVLDGGAGVLHMLMYCCIIHYYTGLVAIQESDYYTHIAVAVDIVADIVAAVVVTDSCISVPADEYLEVAKNYKIDLFAADIAELAALDIEAALNRPFLADFEFPVPEKKKSQLNFWIANFGWVLLTIECL